MKATLLFESHQLFVTKTGETVEIHMDLFELAVTRSGQASEFRFSWIAFDAKDAMRRVLFDSHPPKGPHFHLDADPIGQSFVWVSVEESIELFRRMVTEHFGELEAVSNDGGHEL